MPWKCSRSKLPNSKNNNYISKALRSLHLPSNELTMKWKIWVKVTVPRLSHVTGQSIHITNTYHFILISIGLFLSNFSLWCKVHGKEIFLLYQNINNFSEDRGTTQNKKGLLVEASNEVEIHPSTTSRG